MKALAGFGVRKEDICAIMGLRSPKTLRKRFRRELDLGVVEARAKVTQAAFKLATSGRDPTSTMFWLKRARALGVKDPESDARDEVFEISEWEDPEPGPPEAKDTYDSGIIFEKARPKPSAPGGYELEGVAEEDQNDDSR